METDPKFALERAIDEASLWHYGQRDKLEQPYILHCLRVMLKGRNYNEMIVGVLHDIVEDTGFSITSVDARFGEEIAAAVEAITHRPNEPNEDYIQRVKANPIACQVKIYDLDDNTSEERMEGLDDATRERLSEKYTRAYEILYGED